ncbi:MAG: hypothetical protein C0522_00280 [Rhodocyclaceae bacterium]|jgi:hypothetical protein|nr:hypothetical protein [Rhodocyclaceae bacterium]
MVSKSALNPLALAGQALLYGLFAVIIGYFSTAPKYEHLPPDHALIKLSFSHHGQPVAECRKRTPEELARLAPNMRAPMECVRERSPVRVQVDLDGEPLFAGIAPPSGLSRDGTSTIYRRFEIPAGEHTLAVKMNDSVRIKDFNFSKAEKVTLKPAQILVIDFDAEKGGVVFIQ